MILIFGNEDLYVLDEFVSISCESVYISNENRQVLVQIIKHINNDIYGLQFINTYSFLIRKTYQKNNGLAIDFDGDGEFEINYIDIINNLSWSKYIAKTGNIISILKCKTDIHLHNDICSISKIYDACNKHNSLN